MKVDALQDWAEKELVPKAKLAFDGLGSFSPGKHCRFCKARGVCKAYADMNLEIANYDFKDNALLSDHEISDILKRADIFTKWIASVEEHALQEALDNGKHWPGFKLVEGKSNRKYSSEEEVGKTLLENGFDEKVIYEKKLLTITKLEKQIGKPAFNTHISPLLIKPPGAPTLVPQSDKRPEYNSVESAKQDFANIQN